MKITVLLAAASFVAIVSPAYAGPCSKEIAAVTKLLSGDTSGALSSLAGTTSAPSTSTLSAVTGGSGAAAAAPAASPEALEAIDNAKQADAAGNEASCMDYIKQAKELLGLIQ